MPVLEPQADRQGRWRVLFRAQVPFFLGVGFIALLTAFAVPDLLDEPLSGRLGVLDEYTGAFAMPRLLTGDAAQANAFFDATVVSVDSNDPAGYDVVVNATQLGLAPDDAPACDVARMDGHAALFDVLLRGQPTPLVQAARARGLNAQAGFEMLIQQMPEYLAYFGHPEAAEDVRRDATFLRELIYPDAMRGEIAHPLRYHSASVA